MALTLYGGARSRASMPRWYLEEKGIAYHWRQLDMEAGEHRQAPFTAINPFAKVPGNGERKRRRYLTREELTRLLAALDGFGAAGVRWRFAQLIRLLLLTGCRVSEIKDARWEWLQGATLVVPHECHKTGASGHPRLVHLTEPALAVLRQLRAASNSEWIIQGQGDGPLIGYQKLWEELCAAAKLTELHVHDLRHHYASMGVTAGLSLPQIGGLLGHASPLTTARYAHLIDEAAAAAAAKVAEMVNNPSAGVARQHDGQDGRTP